MHKSVHKSVADLRLLASFDARPRALVLPVASIGAIPLAVAAVSRLAKRPRAAWP